MDWPHRLRDSNDLGAAPELRRAQDLLAAADSSSAPDISERRVYRALVQRPRRRRYRALWLAGLAALFGTAAGATIAHRHWPLPTIVQTKQQRHPRNADAGAATVRTPLTVQAAATSTAEPIVTKLHKHPPRMRSHVQPKPHNAALPAPAVLLMQATSALRVRKDPAAALFLVSAYIKAAPTGPLVEEAMGLALEAAQLEGPEQARAWAARYLERFPNGRYIAQATRLVIPRAP